MNCLIKSVHYNNVGDSYLVRKLSSIRLIISDYCKSAFDNFLNLHSHYRLNMSRLSELLISYRLLIISL